MNTFTIISSTGEALRVISLSNPEDLQSNISLNEDYVEGEPPNLPAYLHEGSWVTIPKAPSPFHTWDPVSKSWTDPGDTPEILAERSRLLRETRDVLLAEADVLLLRSLEDGVALGPIKAYRQALRDMGLQETLKEPVWPTPP